MALVTAGVVMLDCAEPEKLAEFYKGLLEGEETEVSANRLEIRGGDGTRMAFRRDANATPPSWPRPENALQAHLEFLVEDLDEAERRVVGLGGRPLEAKPAPEAHEERLFSDPAGHSFTLRRTVSTAPKQG
ncbi:VOC family protein [Streptomyces antibioticus]